MTRYLLTMTMQTKLKVHRSAGTIMVTCLSILSNRAARSKLSCHSTHRAFSYHYILLKSTLAFVLRFTLAVRAIDFLFTRFSLLVPPSRLLLLFIYFFFFFLPCTLLWLYFLAGKLKTWNSRNVEGCNIDWTCSIAPGVNDAFRLRDSFKSESFHALTEFWTRIERNSSAFIKYTECTFLETFGMIYCLDKSIGNTYVFSFNGQGALV